MSRVVSKIKQGDRVVWFYHDNTNTADLILSGIVEAETGINGTPTYLVSDILMHSFESPKGQTTPIHLEFSPRANIERSIVKRMDDAKWKL